jgi:hypothetical protein
MWSNAISLIGITDQTHSGLDRSGTISYRLGRASFTARLISGTVRNVSITGATATAPPRAFAETKDAIISR